MIERLLIALVLLALGAILYRVYTARQLKRTSATNAIDPLLMGARPNTPIILYFTTPDCVPCRTVQMPVLDKLQTDLGENLQVIKVDATERPQDADRWGVLCSPTTFVIDSNGRTRAVNHGTAFYHTLRQQLSGVVE